MPQRIVRGGVMVILLLTFVMRGVGYDVVSKRVRICIAYTVSNRLVSYICYSINCDI
jgi:hypothetical protein